MPALKTTEVKTTTGWNGVRTGDIYDGDTVIEIKDGTKYLTLRLQGQTRTRPVRIEKAAEPTIEVQRMTDTDEEVAAKQAEAKLMKLEDVISGLRKSSIEEELAAVAKADGLTWSNGTALLTASAAHVIGQQFIYTLDSVMERKGADFDLVGFCTEYAEGLRTDIARKIGYGMTSRSTNQMGNLIEDAELTASALLADRLLGDRW